MHAWKRCSRFSVLFLLLFLAVSLQAQSGNSLKDLVMKEAAKTYAASDLKESQLSYSYATAGLNVTHVYLQQYYLEIPVFNGVINAAVRAGEVVHLNSTYIKGMEQRVTADLRMMAAAQAMNYAANHVQMQLPSNMGTAQITYNADGLPVKYLYAPVHENEERPAVELFWYQDPQNAKQVNLCWEVILDDQPNQNIWHIMVDAHDGSILGQYDAVVKCFSDDELCITENELGYTNPSNQVIANKDNHASILGMNMPMMSATYNVFDAPIESPTFGSRSLVMDPWDRNGMGNPAGTLMWHNDGTNIYTYTRGNNVYAYEDTLDTDPILPATGVTNGHYSPDGGMTFNFDFPLNLANHPRTNLDPAITNLFFWNNLNHDIFYQYGFDEPAGNFQIDNLARGGAGNDAVRAEALDGFRIGSRNNANFFTPDDGMPPRMQMFVWNVPPPPSFIISSPANIAGSYKVVESDFSPNNKLANVGPVSGAIYYIGGEGCLASDYPGALSGKIALIDRGTCAFAVKVKFAQDAGAIGAIVVNNNTGGPTTMGGNDPSITIPAVMISMADGALIKAETNGTVMVSMSQSTGLAFNLGDLDNGIITHEYGHGISNRLTGGPMNSGCLVVNEQMGEGWSDYFALMLTTNWATAAANDRRPVGTYALNDQPDGFGIRPFPYSYDLSINPVTYADLPDANLLSQPHGIGTVWASMLWDMTWNIINIQGADTDMYHGVGGNNIALQLVIDGLKLQTCNPGFVDGRDAILLADQLRYGGAHICAIWDAFARRGLGYSASQGSPNDRSDGVPAYDVLPTTVQKTISPDTATEGDVVNIHLDVTCGCVTGTVTLQEDLGNKLSHVSGGSASGNLVSFPPLVCDVPLSVTSYDIQARVNSCTYSVVIDTLFDEDFDAMPFQIQSDYLSGSLNWNVIGSQYHSPPYSAYALDFPSPSDNAILNATPILLDQSAELSFYHRFETEDEWDGGVVEISTDNGTTWTDLESLFTQNGYTGRLQTFGRNGFEGSSDVAFGIAGFVESKVDLTPFTGQSVFIRFRFLTDPATGGTGLNGWYIDDIKITSINREAATARVLDSGGGILDEQTCTIAINQNTVVDLTCHDLVNVSLSSTCERLISPEELATTICSSLSDRFMVQIDYPETTHQFDPANRVDVSHVGRTLTYHVSDSENGNRCWGKIKVEDKIPPQILCQNTTVSCFNLDELVDAVSIDNCDEFPTQIDILEKKWTDLGCDGRELIGYMARKVRATDVWGNYNECRDTLFVRKETIDSLVCGPDTLIECTTEVIRNNKAVELLWNTGKNGDTYLDAQGYAHPWPTKGDGYFPAPYLKSTQPGQDSGYLLPLRMDAGPDFTNTGKCQIVFDYEDHIVPTCGRSYKIRRTWHIYDWCGKQDTTCVQWFKITDTQAPVIASEFLYSREQSCATLPNSTIEEANRLGSLLACTALEAEVDPHDCKAGLSLPDPRAWVEKDCDDVLEVYYEIEYVDPTHPGKVLLESGTIAEGGTAHVYLPAGWHNVVYHVRDRCWNETLLLQGISIYDNSPPTPVCDEITQVTLDPEKCWARVYAKDLDDGSHDNCCDKLHFAVANMDSVIYWREYWQDYFSSCFGSEVYQANLDELNTVIEEWINVFVFDDYIDVTECGREQLVLRVYEACNLPEYDPHTFFGGEHEWYWYNHSLLFIPYYLWRLDDYINDRDPRLNFVCADINGTNEIRVDDPVFFTLYIDRHFGSMPEFTRDGYFGCTDASLESNSLLENIFSRLSKLHTASPISLCQWGPISQETKADWEQRVLIPYRTEAEITKKLNLTGLYYTPVRYNDCMIEVIKDDKTPPVVVAPEDVTVYCDGVPYWWTLTKPYAGGTKTATVTGHGAQFTHDVCEGEDALQTYCSSPDVYPEGKNTSGDLAEGPVCCVEIPWDGGDFGYYGGSVCGEYSYAGGVNCDEYNYWYESHNWQPIYCRLWLMLDKYDNPDGGHPDPQSYFDETAEDWVITDNCWAPETEVEYSGSLNECGVGTLTKTVTATDKCGNTAYDTQTLYVKPRSDFEVIFPEDVVVNCTDPGSLAADRTGAGYPEISDDDCELIGVTYSDERYEVTEGCYKILRTWKLIDWCVYSPDLHSRYPDVIVDDRLVASESRCCIHRNLKDDGDGYMTYLQVIKVVDDEAPVIVCNELEETCILDNNCVAATVRYELLASGTDNCATEDEIKYRYTVLADETTPVTYGQGHELTAELAVGTYGVWLVGKDRCGNEDSCYTTFTIRDCKNPTPYCYHGIATVVMSPSGEVEVWATDFDAGSYDNCTTADKLILSFTEDGETPSITFTCADIPDGRSQEIEVEIWVIDESGNKDFCTTTLLLQDNTGNACQDSSPLTESGSGVASPEQKVKGEGIRTPELYQNTPNPFSGETKIGFWLPESMTATLKVMDVTGKELYRVTGSYSGGNHLITLEAGSIPEVKGVLFYQLETNQGVINKRMVRVE